MAATERPLRVLIADDDDHTRNLLRELVEGWGYVPLVAKDGEEAMLLAAHGADLALLDLMMPRLDGFTALQRLRAAPATAEMPVILLTASGEVDAKLRGIELGADDYVTKPFRISELQRRVSAALEKRRAGAAGTTGDEGNNDPLTGVGTFPQLRETLAYEVERAKRYGRPLTALMVAVDAPADGANADAALLQQLAQALRRSFRLADRVFRIDVEAFVVLLPETSVDGAQVAAARLTQSVREEPLEASAGPMTISVGVADYPRFGKEKADDLVRAAHRALQRAQRSGAARVELAAE